MIQDNNARESALLANFSDRKYIFRLRKDKCSSAKSSPKDCFVFLHEWHALLPLHGAKRILAQMSSLLYDLGKVSRETVFIDGKKIEACANKSRLFGKSRNKKSGKVTGKNCCSHYGMRAALWDSDCSWGASAIMPEISVQPIWEIRSGIRWR